VFIKIKNWEKHQHYKNRRPPWIKLHVELLNDFHYICLQDASKLLLIHLWLLASQKENKVPANLQYLQKMLPVKVTGVTLKDLEKQGFIILCKQDASDMLASCEQVAIVETETDKETEKNMSTYSCSEQKSCSKPDRVKIQFSFKDNCFENIQEETLDLWAGAYPAVDLNSELNAMSAWLVANPKNRKSNYEKFIVNWLKRSQDKARRV
jgi:hypothetical protein